MDAFNAGQWSVLERIARGAPLSEVLLSIVELIEAQAPDMLCSILLFDPEHATLHHGAAPRLPVEYVAAIDGSRIAPDAGSCGAAAARREQIVVEDVSTHHYWDDYRHLVLKHGLRACWSTPIFSGERELLGTFAMYYREVRAPSERESAWIAVATHLAAIAITRERSERSLRESEARARQLARLYSVSSSISEAIVRVTDARQLYEIACRTAVENGLARLAWVCVHDAGDGSVRCAARFGADAGYVDAVVARLGDPTTNDSIIGRVMQSGSPVVVNDIANDPAIAWKAYPLEQGLLSCGIFPLSRGGGSSAVLAIYSGEVGFFREEETHVLSALGDNIAFAVEAAHRDAERRVAEAALRQNQALLRMAGHAARLGGWQLDLPERRVSWSDEVCSIHDVPVGATPTLAQAIEFYAPEFRDLVRASVEACARDGTPFDIEARLVTRSQRTVWVRSIGLAERGEDGTIQRVLGAFQDIDERRKLEDQLLHAQKMQAIGNLAGSVAHDFNNLLSVILSYSALLLQELKPLSPQRADVEAIQRAGERASDLTRQLLAFSRRQVLSPRIVDLNAAVREAERMLLRLLGADVELVTRLDANLSTVKVDPGQIDQVIMNLAVNARDAMPSGGKLTIETHDVVLDAEYAAEHLGVTPGPHVMLAVSDTGQGMDKATLARIFEPFFTTKDRGKGTGLGLSTVFGIVQQSGGSIWVYSEPGKGTTFKVYFPKTREEGEPALQVPEPKVLHGSETILLVEDQDEVRAVAREVLRRYGYDVIETRNAGEALLECERHPSQIDLLLTDVVMPRMNGRELAERLLQIRPTLRVLFMSGYTEDAVVHHGVLDSDVAYLQKPLLPSALAARVREVLDAPVKQGRG